MRNKGVSNTVILVIIVIIAAVAGLSLISGGEEIGSSETKIVSVSNSPEDPQPGENITISCEIQNQPADVLPSFICHSYFRAPRVSTSGTFLKSDGAYSSTINPFTKAREEISYFVITWDKRGNSILSDEHIIQVGDVKRDNSTSLRITGVDHGPLPAPNSSTELKVSAKVEDNVPIASVWLISALYGRESTKFGKTEFTYTNMTEMTKTPDNNYEGEVTPPVPEEKWPTGTKIMYKIVGKDYAKNTAVTEWYKTKVQ